MKRLGVQCSFLKASAELQASLEACGERKRYAAEQPLFREDEGNRGVYLVISGRVRMSIGGLPKLDRMFSSGSVLGLPSTFTGHPYSLTAVALTNVELLHVPQEGFVELMRERSELCREATEMLGREVSFIQSALTKRRKSGNPSRLIREPVCQ